MSKDKWIIIYDKNGTHKISKACIEGVGFESKFSDIIGCTNNIHIYLKSGIKITLFYDKSASHVFEANKTNLDEQLD